jgi:hypothetical protein
VEAALAYLRVHSNPAFTLGCRATPLVMNHDLRLSRGLCPGQMVIAIADPCPRRMNEAANSWILYARRPGPLDPDGAR